MCGEMMIDDRFVYVFIRQDIALADQLVQAMHAVFNMVACRREYGEPNIVLIGIPNEKSLNRVLLKLQQCQLPHFAWREPDLAIGFTAIATSPLDSQQKQSLCNYRLWRHSPGAVETSPCSFTRDGGAKADVAQLREHSVSNGGVVGANPAVGSIKRVATNAIAGESPTRGVR